MRNQAAFESRYSAGLPIAGEWQSGDKIDNGGENMKLSYGAGSTIHEFTYDDFGPDSLLVHDSRGFDLVARRLPTMPIR